MKIARSLRQPVVIGAFPPPVHGMAAVNAAARDALRKANTEPLIVDIAARSLNRSLKAKLGRLPRVMRGIVQLARTPRSVVTTVYMSVSGGYGQLYELAFVSLARLKKMPLYLHHHSSAYIHKPSLLTRLLVKAAGPTTIHVVQSKEMGRRLQDTYGIGRFEAISNAVILPPNPFAALGPPRSLSTLGFVSNIAREKGVFDYLDLMGAVTVAKLPLNGILAGPFQDDDTERAVRAKLRALPNVQYVGPVYGPDKEKFFARIDCLILPTRYFNESEPIVTLEAMSHGIPVIAYGRGCIPEIVGDECGKVIDAVAAFVPSAMAQLQAWCEDSDKFSYASMASLRRFGENYHNSTQLWNALLAELAGCSRENTPLRRIPEEC